MDAESGDDPFRQWRHVRDMSELFSRVDVRHVAFNDGNLQNAQGITHGDAVVGPGTGVDDHRVHFLEMRLVDLLAELPFKVGLEGL